MIRLRLFQRVLTLVPPMSTVSTLLVMTVVAGVIVEMGEESPVITHLVVSVGSDMNGVI